MNIYDELEKLKEFLDSGAITQEEYEREKERILQQQDPYQGQYQEKKDSAWDLGIDENTFVALLHASQFISAFIIPLIIWLLYKDKSPKVDAAGKNILNFEISFTLYSVVLFLTIIGSILLPIPLVIMFAFIIIAIVKAVNGENWKYPLSIRFLK
ncbi:MAG: DUF4870 domain-containing protein [Tannerella sp.]|jgi:uncharacterized Tic20 family protein|nr:DUF4870 domain-containing protein [Tannerella sp.]